MPLARALHKYWVERYFRQFPLRSDVMGGPKPLAGIFNIVRPTTEDPHYEEPEDDRVFQDILAEHEDALYVERLQGVWDDVTLHQREPAAGTSYDSPQVPPGRNKTGVPLQLMRVAST